MQVHKFLNVVGYNGNCTSSDECARGFRCIEMKCSCLDTDTYYDVQEGCKKSILNCFLCVYGFAKMLVDDMFIAMN